MREDAYDNAAEFAYAHRVVKLVVTAELIESLPGFTEHGVGVLKSAPGGADNPASLLRDLDAYAERTRQPDLPGVNPSPLSTWWASEVNIPNGAEASDDEDDEEEDEEEEEPPPRRYGGGGYGRGRGGGECWTCGSYGHYSYSCPAR